MSFFKKVSTNVARAKQMAMVKMGQTEATVDPQFNELEQHFKDQYSRMKKLGKFFENYQKAVRELDSAQQGMAQLILDQYDMDDHMYGAASEYTQTILPQIHELQVSMEQHYSENIFQPLVHYMTQYKMIEERISERNTRLLDMDRYNSDLKILLAKTEADPAKISIAKEKAELKTQGYTQLNQELSQDIPRLLQDRARFFDALFANLIQGQSKYLIDAAVNLGLMDKHFESVDRVNVLTWQFVVTPSSASAASVLGASLTDQVPPSNFSQSDKEFETGNTDNASPINLGKSPEPSTPSSSNLSAVALYPFQGQDHTELTFQANDVIVIYRNDGEWWEGEFNGRRGLFPSNYVRLV